MIDLSRSNAGEMATDSPGPLPSLVCANLPATPSREIPRDNVMDTIDALLDGDVKIALVEGPEGRGKTVLLSQLARRHAKRAVGVFIAGGSRWTYDVETVRFEIANQLSWLLHGAELSSPSDATDTRLGILIHEARRLYRKTGTPFLFVVDGIHDIPADDVGSRRQLLSLLPIGEGAFRFVISGDVSDLPLPEKSRALAKPYPLTLFSLAETKHFFDNAALTPDHIAELHRVSKGAPGVLASFKRLLESGDYTPESLLADLPARLPEAFEREWQQVDEKSEHQALLLAVLALDRRSYTTASLGTLVNIEANRVNELLAKLSFVEIDLAKSGSVRFVNDSFKRFVAAKLSHLQARVSEILIQSLMSDPNSPESQDLLPSYLREGGRLEQLIGFLTMDLLAAYVQRCPSLSTVQKNTDLGIAAAKDLHRNGDWVRLSLQKSTIAALDDSHAARAELRALAAIGDHEGALAIAEGTTRHEDKLLLLAALARSRREAGLSVPPEVQEQISQLYEMVDFAIIGNHSESLSADLLYCRPDLALKTVERANKAKSTSSSLQSTDWTYAKLALEARLAEQDSGRSAEQIAAIMDLIKDPKAIRLATESAVVFGDIRAEDAIADAMRLTNPEDQVYVLRQWMLANSTRPDVAVVLAHALGIAIGATDYTPTARHIRELVSGVPYIKDESTARHLIGMLDGQAPELRNTGPTEDYVGIQLLIARAEYAYSRDSARNRFVELYLLIASLEDIETRIVATARFVGALSHLDREDEIELREGVRSVAEADLAELIAQLLGASADHYEATRDLIKALAGSRTNLAMDVIASLNTEPRRDWAYRDLVASLARTPPQEIDFGAITLAMTAIANSSVRDSALADLINAISHLKFDQKQLKTGLQLLDAIRRIGRPEIRARAAAQAAAFLKNQDDAFYTPQSLTLLGVCQDAWSAIDPAWLKLTIGFELVVFLSRAYPETARQFLDRAGSVREEAVLYNNASAGGAIWCIRLAIRAFTGLLPRRLATDLERVRLESAIGSVPSDIARADLWADLAERYHLNDHPALCRDVVETRLKPLLTSLEETAAGSYYDVAARCAAALFSAHHSTTLAMIERLPTAWADQALFNITEFIKRKCPLSDPFERRAKEGYDISFGDAVDVCELVERMDQDSAAYYAAEGIVDSLTSTKCKLSRQQKNDVARRLGQIAEKQFPNSRYIKHDGYKIALQAQIAKIRPPDAAAWQALVQSAQLIPNVADRAYVLTIVAAASRDPKERASILSETENAIRAIPMLVDQVDHYRLTGAHLVGVDKTASKSFLRTGLQFSLRGKGAKIVRSRRAIVDLAYRVDAEFASKLASSIDDDPAKDRVRRQIALHQLQASMAQERPDMTAVEMEDLDYSRAAWMRLGALTADRVDHVPMDTALRYVEVASRQPMSRSYPIFALLIENAVRRHAKTDAARSTISPLFEASLLGAELVIHASTHTKFEKRIGLEAVRQRAAGQQLTVSPGHRDAGVAFVRQWLEASAGDYLKICDPYFTPKDLEILRIVKSARPNCRISILTSQKAHLDGQVPQSWQAAYVEAWKRACDEIPPQTDVSIVGQLETGGSPIHDRWWIGRGGGLEVGTSWSGIGTSSSTSIRIMDPSEAADKEAILDEFLVRMVREFEGKRYLYTTVALGIE
jgi:hypothetical protein